MGTFSKINGHIVKDSFARSEIEKLQRQNARMEEEKAGLVIGYGEPIILNGAGTHEMVSDGVLVVTTYGGVENKGVSVKSKNHFDDIEINLGDVTPQVYLRKNDEGETVVSSKVCTKSFNVFMGNLITIEEYNEGDLLGAKVYPFRYHLKGVEV